MTQAHHLQEPATASKSVAGLYEAGPAPRLAPLTDPPRRPGH
ncbi:hypothetical protein SAMN04487938_0889 [Lysobacter sp. cf310]|nr:hypothetical protein SAMN04487938_0889 [Lysobacter sp. cf310]